MAFSLAAGITLAEDSTRAGERSAGDLAALQAILDAQQAVMVATIAAGTASSSSAAGT